MMQERPLGFVAFWKATDAWFAATEEEKAIFMEELQAVNQEAQAKGVVMHGSYDCSWSCEWRYFTFWTCPTLEILEETMEKLLKIGDINLYNVQHHYVGRLTADEFVQ